MTMRRIVSKRNRFISADHNLLASANFSIKWESRPFLDEGHILLECSRKKRGWGETAFADISQINFPDLGKFFQSDSSRVTSKKLLKSY